MRVYIAGPMTGLPDHNYPAFHRAATLWRNAGYEVINPAENHDGRTDLPLEDYFATDLPQICWSDAIALLPGWQESNGAAVELALAKHLGKEIIYLDENYDGTNEPLEEPIAEEAMRLVYGDRQAAYGHPAEDFARTGRMWAAILGLPEVTPQQVGLCMAALKLSRQVNKPKRDNLVDAIGYVLTVDRIVEGR